MSKLKKLLERIRNNPKHVKFEELDKILIHFGFTRRQASKGTSHFYYTKGEKLLSVPFYKLLSVPFYKYPRAMLATINENWAY